MAQKEKPIFRVIVWKGESGLVDYANPFKVKNFRTLKAAENFAKKWGEKEWGTDGFYDPEMTWNNAAQELLEKA